MKLFGKAKTKKEVLLSPVSGEVVEMKDIADSAFSGGLLGICIGIEPDEGSICSPCDGVITQAAAASHAIGIKSSFGAGILIHAGIDTVQLMGEGFMILAGEGEHVSAGQRIMSFDPERVRSAGYGTTVITAVTDAAGCTDIRPVCSGTVRTGERLFEMNCGEV